MEMSKETLMPEEEYNRWAENEDGGKNLVWNNYFQKIDQYREYKGHWHQENREVWEGLGVIKFSDGSIYQGFTQDQQLNGVGRMSHANGDIYQG